MKTWYLKGHVKSCRLSEERPWSYSVVVFWYSPPLHPPSKLIDFYEINGSVKQSICGGLSQTQNSNIYFFYLSIHVHGFKYISSEVYLYTDTDLYNVSGFRSLSRRSIVRSVSSSGHRLSTLLRLSTLRGHRFLRGLYGNPHITKTSTTQVLVRTLCPVLTGVCLLGSGTRRRGERLYFT